MQELCCSRRTKGEGIERNKRHVPRWRLQFLYNSLGLLIFPRLFHVRISVLFGPFFPHVFWKRLVPVT